jgi:uncharacterized protein DUF4260
MIKKLLHLEGLAFFITAIYFYNYIHGNWLLFILLLFVPDISMIGYIKNKKLGAILYNLVHNYVLSLIIISTGFLWLKNYLITVTGIILFAHVAIDRFLGYGLKYPTDFKSTHLQRV